MKHRRASTLAVESIDAGKAIEIPDFALIILIGASGAGKSTFAKRFFSDTEIIASDDCRNLVCDDPSDVTVSQDAFELLRTIAEKRLKNRRLTVIDATNVRADDRKLLLDLARAYHALPIAIVLDPGINVCITRNKARVGHTNPRIALSMTKEIHAGLHKLNAEGFRAVYKLSSEQAIDNTTITRRPLWTDKRDLTCGFDIIGDAHGCASELERLIIDLGYTVSWSGKDVTIGSPHGRMLAFLGDLCDRGPRTPDVYRLAMAAVKAGVALAVQGNHDKKLGDYLSGRKKTVSAGIQKSVDQLNQESEEFRAEVSQFLEGLRSHYWLDNGRLAIAHAGLKADMIGRGSGVVRSFALFGETTGEHDEYGHPIRIDWAADYKGPTTVVYGHTTVVEPEWVNRTICIDTGCVFGGKLTALRWPEKTLVSVAAEAVHYPPKRPLDAPYERPAVVEQLSGVVDFADISGRRTIETHFLKNVLVSADQASAALEDVTRFAMPASVLAYLPPTMSPVESSTMEGWLERPEEAFLYYSSRGITDVVVEMKHMGSRAIIAVCRTSDACAKRFPGLSDGAIGAIWTRTGRCFFNDPSTTAAILVDVATAATRADLWAQLSTDWLLIDAEIMPWSAKATALIDDLYAPVASSAIAGLSAAEDAVRRGAARGLPVHDLHDRTNRRLDCAIKYSEAWAPYVWSVDHPSDLRIAPFHILASEGNVHFDKSHDWHMTMAHALASVGVETMTKTPWMRINLDDAAVVKHAIDWWEYITQRGGEGMVVKPFSFIERAHGKLVQPALKVRGREYLRIIYGPEYDLPENLERLRSRNLGYKRNNAIREFALGHEALQRFVEGASLSRVFECVFGVLAIESEPLDPRL